MESKSRGFFSVAHLDSMDELGATSPRVETKRTLMFHHVRQHGRGLPGVPRYTDDLQPIGSTYVIYMNTTKDPTVHVARYTIHLKISSNFRSKRNPGLLAKWCGTLERCCARAGLFPVFFFRKVGGIQANYGQSTYRLLT